MQRITQNAQTSSVPCQLTYFEVRREMLGGNMATPTTEPVRLPPGPRAPKIVQGVTFLTARQPVRSPRSSASGARTCRWPRPGSAHSTPDRRVRGKTPRSTPRICAHATITRCCRSAQLPSRWDSITQTTTPPHAGGGLTPGWAHPERGSSTSTSVQVCETRRTTCDRES